MEKIKIKRGNAWGAVPEALIEDPRLGHAAARLGCWLATRPNNWNVDKEYAKKVCRLGESLWDKGCKELRAAGYIVTTQVRESGKFRGLNWAFNPVPDPPDPDATGGGFSAHGEPTHLTRTLKTKTLKQQQQPKQQQRRREVVREVVVVVNNEEDSGQREMQIHWPPNGIEVSDKNKILNLLSRFDVVEGQEIVDEIAGRILISTVRSPVGLARKLAELKQAKRLVCELADGVREGRESRERNLARIAQSNNTNHVVKQVDDKHPKLSEEAERAREKLKELRDSIRRKN